MAVSSHLLLDFLGFLFAFHDGQRVKRKTLTKWFFLRVKYKLVLWGFISPSQNSSSIYPSLHEKKKIFIHVKNFCEKNQQYQCYLAGLCSAILQQVLFWIGSIRRDDIIFIWFWKKKTKSVISVKVNFGCDACRRSFLPFYLCSATQIVQELSEDRSAWHESVTNGYLIILFFVWLFLFSSQRVWLLSVMKYIFFLSCWDS